MDTIVNVNCGVLGHVDSGKTSLCRSLHEIASTASMDKNPQSRERGITLDLGFSAFIIPPRDGRPNAVQVTMVDCPGHATLIRTVMAGAQIMDVCLLVVDAQKGFQTQTAECLVIAEIMCTKLCIVVNKMDLISPESRLRYQETFTAKTRKLLSNTRFHEDVPISFLSAETGDGIPAFIDVLSGIVGPQPIRDSSGPLHITYDHCFSVKGQGTVFTGTVLSGSARKGQKVTIPSHNETVEIRSIQKFHKPADSAIQGDRIGICLPGTSPSDKERGDIYDLSFRLENSNLMLLLVKPIKYFKMKIDHAKFHISVGHQHTIASPIFFRTTKKEDVSDHKASVRIAHDIPTVTTSLHTGSLIGDIDSSWLYAVEQLHDLCTTFDIVPDLAAEPNSSEPLFCFLPLPRRIKYPHDALVIASKLDLDEEYTGCRLAFYGRVLPNVPASLKGRVIKLKVREGVIERQHAEREFLVKGLVNKQSAIISDLIGQTVILSKTSTSGKILGTFGKSGLLRVQFDEGLPDDLIGETVLLRQIKPALIKVLQGYDGF